MITPQDREAAKSPAEVFRALKDLQATAQALIVHLECQPVLLAMVQKGIPAGWKMFEECTGFASDVIAKQERKP